MIADIEQPLEFKFQFLNDNGQPVGLFRKRGRFDGETLTLDKAEIPALALVDTAARDRRFGISVMQVGGEVAFVSFMLSTKKASDALKRRLDIVRSAAFAKMHREQLKTLGRESAYRDAECPQCRATILLSDIPDSPQLFCPYCRLLSVIDAGEFSESKDREFGLCDECGMFSKPQKFTIFYFYFLLVVVGAFHRETWRCPGCMRKDAWKMLFGNLPFLIGVPVAMTQLIRSYGSNVIGGGFKGLDAANLKARNGKLDAALEMYRTILERTPYAAGVKYNIGLALRQQNDLERAAKSFEFALRDCSNYAPAYWHLREIYEQLGETERLAELREMFEDPQEPESPPSGE